MHWNCNRPDFSRLEVIKALVPYFLSCLRIKAQRLTQQHFSYCLVPRKKLVLNTTLQFITCYRTTMTLQWSTLRISVTEIKLPQENHTSGWEITSFPSILQISSLMTYIFLCLKRSSSKFPETMSSVKVEKALYSARARFPAAWASSSHAAMSA